MAIIAYDKKSVYHNLLLALPFREATGLITRDRATPHHQDVDLVGAPSWVSLANGLGVLDFNAAAVSHYLECLAVNTADLNFTTGDYSIAVWVNHKDTGHFQPKIVVGRYGVDLDGWEIYLETNAILGVHYLEHRHHHASHAPTLRTGCYSTGWTPDTGWALIGITRHKSGGVSYPQHYRNGTLLEMTWVTGGMLDPDTCNRDLVIGARFTKDQDWYDGRMWNLRIWNRELSEDEMRFLFNCERHWFGV